LEQVWMEQEALDIIEAINTLERIIWNHCCNPAS